MAMFPDSGVPPGDAKNSLPDVNTADCDELWYSTSRCQPRFDPAAANAMLAEDMNLIMRGELKYDCFRLDHIERAVRYISQRGLTTGVTLTGGPFDYAGLMDPVLTRYNDYLTLIAVPVQRNQGAVRINIDGFGLTPLLRNDGRQMESEDLRAYIPCLISYWQGNWYHVGMVQSQVPIVIKGAVDIWIRTDGNDITGDGSANSPDKAFKTINGAWNRVGARYAATPLFTMNMRLGIPGTYQGSGLGPFGGRVTLQGDVTNPSAYRLSSVHGGNGVFVNLVPVGMAQFEPMGITFVRDVGPPYINHCIWGEASTIDIHSCNFDSAVANANSTYVQMGAGNFRTRNGDYYFDGNNLPIGALFRGKEGAVIFCGGNSDRTLPSPRFFFRNNPIQQCAWIATTLTVATQISNGLDGVIYNTNNTGAQYSVDRNSVLTALQSDIPGNAAGVVATGGQFVNST